MNCREAEKRIYIYTELSPRERKETDIHIQSCASCKAVLEHVTSARSIAMSSSTPPLVNPGDMTRRIMNAVHTSHPNRSFSFPRFGLLRFNNGLRYGMAALSFCLLVSFFAEYNRDLQPRRPTAMYTINTKDVKLNTASFSRTLAAARERNDGGTALYECVVNCLRTGDGNCNPCTIRFSKPK